MVPENPVDTVADQVCNKKQEKKLKNTSLTVHYKNDKVSFSVQLMTKCIDVIPLC